MSDLARIEIERDVADAAARRAAQAGLSVTAYVSLLLRRSFERTPGEERVLAFDHIDKSDFGRATDRNGTSQDWRAAIYRLFARR
jgi:hypothetical protein